MKRKLFRLLVGVASAAAITLFSTSCEPNARSGAVAGAATGAAIGLMTDRDGDVLRKAAIGAAIGAGTGAIIKARRYRGGGPATGSHPTASRTSDPNFVKSPYKPYNIIDVTGFRSGERAVDPTTGGVFIVP